MAVSTVLTEQRRCPGCGLPLHRRGLTLGWRHPDGSYGCEPLILTTRVA